MIILCTHLGPGVVEIFNVTSISSNTSLVTWSPPMEPNGIVTEYEVIYSVYGLDNKSVIGPLDNDTYTHNITNLSKLGILVYVILCVSLHIMILSKMFIKNFYEIYTVLQN